MSAPKKPRKSAAQANAETKFHYVVSELGKVRWFATEKAAQRWLESHKTEHGQYVLADFASDALKRSGVAVAK